MLTSISSRALVVGEWHALRISSNSRASRKTEFSKDSSLGYKPVAAATPHPRFQRFATSLRRSQHLLRNIEPARRSFGRPRAVAATHEKVTVIGLSLTRAGKQNIEDLRV